MNSIFFCLLVFVSIIILHIVLHTILSSFGIRTMKLLFLFPVGFFVTVYGVFRIYTQMSFSSLFLYLLMMLVYTAYFMSGFSGEESPSSRIITELKKRKKLTYKEILSFFSIDDLVGKRLSALLSGGLVREQREVLVVTDKGKQIYGLLSWYRRLLQWESSG